MSVSSGHVIVLAAIVLYLLNGALAARREKCEGLLATSKSTGAQRVVNLKALASRTYSTAAGSAVLRFGIGVERVPCGEKMTGACLIHGAGAAAKFEDLGGFGALPQLELQDAPDSVVLRTQPRSANATTFVAQIECLPGLNTPPYEGGKLTPPSPGSSPEFRFTFKHQSSCAHPVPTVTSICHNIVAERMEGGPPFKANLDELASYTVAPQLPLVAPDYARNDEYYFSICSNFQFNNSTPPVAAMRVERETGLIIPLGQWPANSTDGIKFQYSKYSRAIHATLPRLNGRQVVFIIKCQEDAIVPSNAFSLGYVDKTETAQIMVTHRSVCEH